MATLPIDEPALVRCFEFLDALRSGGSMNMFGAAPVLADAYDLSRDDARTVLKAWMDSFADTAAAERARAVISKADPTQ